MRTSYERGPVARTGCAIVLAIALVPVGLASSASSSSQIAVRGRANAYASLAADGQFAVVAWGASTANGVTDIFAAASTDGGRVFGAPTRVNQVAGDANLSGEQPPRIALVPRSGRHPAVVVVWTAKAAAGTRLLSARSDDGARSFAAPIRVPGSEASGNRGWESIATTRDGGIVVVWLDHRELSKREGSATSMNHAEHHHLAHDRAASGQKPADGVARAQQSKLMFARLGDPDSSRMLTGGVCYCCKTAIAADSAGGIYTAWRHVYKGNVRDLAFTKSTDGGHTFTPPVRVSDDRWVLDGCPENGPALAVDEAKRIHVVWPTLVPGATPASEPTLALFYAMSADGRHFTARQRIPTEGFPRHPQITLGRTGELIVTWDEQARGTRRIALAHGAIDNKGTPRFARQQIDDGTRAEYPALARVHDGTLVAWTSGSAGKTVIRVDRLD
jgi:hypothetical protein